jgi:hypothetical protein
MEVWKNNLLKLKAFKRKFGHCNVPANGYEDRVLSQWVRNIRERSHQLPHNLKAELIKLEFKFAYSVLDDWDVMYERLKQFYQKYGHCEIHPKNADQELLAKWIEMQRLSKARLKTKNINKLDAIEFPWEVRKASAKDWLRGFEKLRAHHQKFGTSRIWWRDTKHHDLFEWSRGQIKRYKKGELTEDKIRLLLSVEFDFEAGRKKEEEIKWLKQYEELKKFKAIHGHCNVPSHQKSFRRLCSWVGGNRMNMDTLSEERKNRLNALGFRWSHDIQDKKNKKWESMYEKLKRFYTKKGHINVTKTQDAKLRRWLAAQEERVELTKDRRQKLEKLGMVWKDARKERKNIHWNKMYDTLKKFYQENEHCIVPTKDRKLRLWIQSLRGWNKSLTAEQHKKLKAINFDVDWKRDDFVKLQWEKNYLKLKEFRKRFGHCIPSAKSGDFQPLGRWVASMRRREDSLSAEQIKKLNQIDFSWDRFSINNMKWERRYEELKAFKKKFGSLTLLRKNEKYDELYCWRYMQIKSKHRLSPEQIKKLNQLGMTWTVRKITK